MVYTDEYKGTSYTVQFDLNQQLCKRTAIKREQTSMLDLPNASSFTKFKYGLTEEEQAFIERMIKPME